MKFGNKLSKLRKEHNLSQEQLADKLEVSRQAVSKWESGQSYPDMDKIVVLCKLFDCTIDELINDQKEVTNEKSKKGLMNYVDEFLDFITKTVNMFWSMSFKQKMSCVFQMGVLILILVIIFAIIGGIIKSCFGGMYSILPYRLESFIGSIFLFIYVLICLIIGTIITVHVFKIRFLDYFVTIEDDSTNEKEVEKPVDTPESYKEAKKEKIIIRDPKHSTFGLLKILSKLLNIFLKGCALFALLFLAFGFIFVIFMLVVSLAYISDGMIFTGIIIALLGSALTCFVVGELLYRFIVNIKQHFKITFVMTIISLILIGAGFGISFISYTGFERVKLNDENATLNDNTRKIIHVDGDNVLIDCSYNHYCSKIEYVVNEDLSDIIIVDIKHNSEYNYYVNYYFYDDDEEFKYYNIYSESSYDFFEAYNEVINDFKNKVIRDYSYYPPVELKITSSSKNIEMLKNNYNKFNGE